MNCFSILRAAPLAAAAVLLAQSPALVAQVTTWQVASSNDTLIRTPGFPSTLAPSFFNYSLSDTGNGQITGQITSGGGFSGRWTRRNGEFRQYVGLGIGGALGPGRTGPEADHVFRELRSGDDDTGQNGQIAIAGRAGPASGVVGDLPTAVWRWDTGRNIEIARSLTDGPLGPNLGAGWFFRDNVHPRTRNRADGAVVLDADVVSPLNAQRDAVVLHVPGQGNVPCLLEGSVDPTLSPGLGNGSSFESNVGLGYRPVVIEGSRVFAALRTSAAQESGLWEICDAAPRALAATGRIGSLGPDVGVATAHFTDFGGNVRPGGNGDLIFEAQWRNNAGASLTRGVFRHSSGRNSPIAQLNDNGWPGPNWLGSQFSSINASSLTAVHRQVAFEARVRTTENTNVDGIWRITPDGHPQPVALINVLGEFGPATGQTFARFDRWTLFGNGDIVVDATVNGGISGLYLFSVGRAPRLLLRDGQTLVVNTLNGPAEATITNFSLPNVNDDSAQSSLHWGGTDSWSASDGSMLVASSLAVANRSIGALLLGQVPDVNLLYRNGFEE